jgi:hypothetical protein
VYKAEHDTALFYDVDLSTEPGMTREATENDTRPVNDFASASVDTSSTQSTSSHKEEDEFDGEFIQGIISYAEDFDLVAIANTFMDPTGSQSQPSSEQEEVKEQGEEQAVAEVEEQVEEQGEEEVETPTTSGPPPIGTSFQWTIGSYEVETVRLGYGVHGSHCYVPREQASEDDIERGMGE